MTRQHDKLDPDRLLDDFNYFIQKVWDALDLNHKHPLGWAERDMCEFADRGPRNRIILAPRGIGKTHLVTVARTLVALLRDPDTKTFIVSKSAAEARKTVSIARHWIDRVPFLNHLNPQNHNRLSTAKPPRDALTHFDVGPARPDRTPSVWCAGIEGQLEGGRAHQVIADDVETATNTLTHDARQALDTRVREFASIASYGDRQIIYVGTYHHEESLYLKLNERGYVTRSWPIAGPEPGDNIVGLSPAVTRRIETGDLKPGQPTMPHRPGYDELGIIEKKAEGRRYFAMQFMLIAGLADQTYPLQLRDLIVFDVHRDKAPANIIWGTRNDKGGSTRIEEIPSLGFANDGFHFPVMYDQQFVPYQSTKMWIDPSGRGHNRTGYAVGSQLHGYIFIHEVDGLEGSGSSQENLTRLVHAARKYGATEIHVEDAGGYGLVADLLEPIVRRNFLEPRQDPAFPNGWKCAVIKTKTSGQKELRIIGSLDPLLSQHRVVIHPRVAHNQRLQEQLTRITPQRNSLPSEDELEAMANLCTLFNTNFSVDAEQMAERERQRHIEEQLEQHLRLAGVSITKPGWIVPVHQN